MNETSTSLVGSITRARKLSTSAMCTALGGGALMLERTEVFLVTLGGCLVKVDEQIHGDLQASEIIEFTCTVIVLWF